MSKFNGALCVVGLLCALAFPFEGQASEKFGLIFDVQGNAVLSPRSGEQIVLAKGKDLLRPVFEGDSIEVKGIGSVLVVSDLTGKGYELGPDSIGVVEMGDMTTLKGNITTKDGFSAPRAGEKGPLGVIVLRSANQGHCVKLLNPVGTAIENLTPVIQWQSSCKSGTTFVLKIMDGRQFIHEVAVGTAEKHSVLANVLQHDKTYRWMIETSGDSTFVGAAFSVVSASVSAEVNSKRIAYKSAPEDMARRLAYLLYIKHNYLNEDYAIEIGALKHDFPQSEFVQAFAEK